MIPGTPISLSAPTVPLGPLTPPAACSLASATAWPTSTSSSAHSPLPPSAMSPAAGSPPTSSALFEGPEKKLELDFCVDTSRPRGLRDVSDAQWSAMLSLAGCTIVSATRNEYMDSFVLSESSLFVYPFQVVMKTCGTTTLLGCLPLLLQYARELGLTLCFVIFCRKNYMFPHKQLFPHTTFGNEVTCLNRYFQDAGSAYVLGPLTGDHWYLYTADFRAKKPTGENDQTLEIMMTQLDPTVMRRFHRRPGQLGSQLTRQLGLHRLTVGLHADATDGGNPLWETEAVTDEVLFDPCGYSLNGMLGRGYYTIHVTPEDECSFVSFECNFALASYAALARRIVEIFRPGKFSVTVFTDHQAPGVAAKHEFTEGTFATYAMRHKTDYEFEGDYAACHIHYDARKRSPQAFDGNAQQSASG
jgi:S-adenosylmethionine decarboxylase